MGNISYYNVNTDPKLLFLTLHVAVFSLQWQAILKGFFLFKKIIFVPVIGMLY